LLACRRLPDGARRRLLIELTGLPPHLPQARVRELVSYLRPFTAGILARLDPAGLVRERSGRALDAGLAGLSTNWAMQASPGCRSTSKPWTRITRARSPCSRCSPAGSGFGHSANVGGDRRLCRAALTAGVDHIGGEALLPRRERIG
jgi:hypothetical protein